MGSPAADLGAEGDVVPGTPRFRRADRLQMRMVSASLDELLSEDHVVRVVWDYVRQLDVAPLVANIRSVEHRPGHPATHPHVLIALWLMATLDGVGSARALDRLCRTSIPYRWILGDLSINAHTLSDFRVQHEEFLDGLLTTGVAVLMQEGLVTLKRVAADGMRVRAAAGASSFHREPTLENHLKDARQQIEGLKQELDEDSSAGERRRKAAKERSQRERAERLERALAARQEVEEKNQKRGRGSEKKEARGSSTDPEARRMKMPDGGTRPALNTQLATDVDSNLIVNVIVTNQGTDNTALGPMVEQIDGRFGRRPREMLVDGGFVNHEQIDAVERAGTKVYAPVKNARKHQLQGKDPFARSKGDTPAVGAWKQRMGTDEAREIYKDRASTAEWVNANFRNRGFYRVTVRGAKKVLSVALWQSVAHNFLESIKRVMAAGESRREAAARLGEAVATGRLRAAIAPA
jgi:transposase